MFLITLKDREESVYTVMNDIGEQVLYMFENEDDAIRFAMMLEDERNYPPMSVIEVDDDIILGACSQHEYEYLIFN